MIRLKAQPKRPNFLKAIVRFLSRMAAGCFEVVSDLMQNSLFQLVRLAFTFGLLWVIYQRIDGYRERVGGLTTIELAQFGHAAIVAVGVAMMMAIMWSANFCDGLSGFLLSLIDDPDNRPIQEDPMSRLSRLIHDGHAARARRLCKRMIRRHEGSRLALEATLKHLEGRKDGKTLIRPPRVSGGK